MPRQERKKSSTGIYHIMLRGINQQQIFEDEEDNEKFLEILKEYKKTSYYKIIAYCLMGNHLHLLIKEGVDPLGQIFRKIGAKYVYWYNVKYKRTGHLFQDRYKSEPVENEQYLMTVLRYIHQNPIKANLSNALEKYKWSSYNEYIMNQTSSIIDLEIILSIMNKEQFTKFNNENNNEKCLDIMSNDKVNRITDEEANKVIIKISKCETTADFQGLIIEKRNKYISKIKEKGVSIRQLSRLTGISKGVIEKL